MKFQSYILVLCLVLTAVVTTQTTYDSTLTVKFLPWIACIIIMFLFHKDIDLSIFKRKMFYAFAGYVIICALSILWSQNKQEAIYEVCKAFLMLVTIGLFVSVDGKSVVKALTLLATGLGSLGVYQFCVHPQRFYRWGTMGHKNLFAAALLFLLPFCIYHRHKVFGAMGSVLILFNIFTLHTRSIFIAIFVGSMVLLKLKYKILAMVFFSIVALGVYFERGPGVFNSSTLQERLRLAKWSSEMIQDHPQGVGAGNWRIFIPAYNHNYHPETPEGEFSKYYQRPHNDFILAFCETGIGGIFYLSVFAFGVYYLVRTKDEFAKMMLFGLICYMVFACFSFPRERAFHGVILSFFLAAAVRGYHTPLDYRVSPQIVRATTLLIFVGLLFVGFDFYHRYRTDCIVKEVNTMRYAKDWTGIKEKIGSCSNLSSLDLLGMPLKWYVGEAEYSLGNTKQALVSFQEAYKYNPNHIILLMNIAGCHFILGDKQNALDFYSRALVVQPNSIIANKCMERVMSF